MFVPKAVELTRAWSPDGQNQVVCGDALAVLRQLPESWVDCVVTSPPYWGLRDYRLAPSVWDGDPGCAHTWERSRRRAIRVIAGNPGVRRPCQAAASSEKATTGAFCHRCGAWRGCLGLEPTWEHYVAHLMDIFREVQRVLTPQGSLWLNLGDTFLGAWGASGTRQPRPGAAQAARREHQAFAAKHKLGLPWRVRFALNADGWISRGDIIWHKPNALPASVKDRVRTRYEMLFHLVKSPRYFFDLDAIRDPYRLETPRARHDFLRMMAGRLAADQQRVRQPGRRRRLAGGSGIGANPGDVWTIPTRPFKGAHFATFPEALCVRPILATCPEVVCQRCGEPRRVIRALPSWYESLLRRGEWREWCSGRPNTAAKRPAPLVAQPTGGVVGYTTCDCGGGVRSGRVLDPFAGSGTALVVAKTLGRGFLGIERNPAYCRLIEDRIGLV